MSVSNSGTRRNLIKAGLASATAALSIEAAVPAISAAMQSAAETSSSGGATMIGVPFEGKSPRIGIVGVGGRGTSLLGNLLAADVQVPAVCDLVADKANHAASLIEKSGQKAPTLYTDGEHAFEKLVTRDDIDVTLVATPWRWHTPIAVAAMKAGKHVFTEVPAATTVEECWQLVNTSEQTRRHCIMLENCCYGYNEMLLLNMTKAGLLGDLLYGEAAYLHDLRGELFGNKGEALWRRKIHTERDGNLYPTHGLGPVANYMGINRGDRFDYLVSMSTPARGFAAYRADHLAKDDPRWKENYIDGDLNTSLIKTANGLTVNLQHDISNPQPYSRLNTIAGTKGIFKDYPPRIYLDGQNGKEDWATIDSFKDQYGSDLWKRQGEIARKLGGHGGMDFILLYRLAECIRKGLPPDMDVYDAATWSVPAPLTKTSVAGGSTPIKFPDFTRGRWKDRKGSSIA